MSIEKRINILAKLGEILKNKSKNIDFEKIYQNNPWFTQEFVEFSLNQYCNLLEVEKLNSWTKKYNFPNNSKNKKTVGIIAAGNIPLVGLHDLISCYLAGHNIIIKLSSKDKILMKLVIDTLCELDENCKITITEELLKNFDAIIATGSQNSNIYFDYYFNKYPHIFRNNRSAIAVITPNDNINDFELLADDVFTYFGLGCRNVSKIFIPQNFDFNILGNAFQKYQHLKDHYKYFNNLCYQYALFAMNQIIHANFGNLLLAENKNIFSPIAVLHYEYYSDIENVKYYIAENQDNIQCVVSNDTNIPNAKKLGQAQKPELYDYADNVDTIQFLLNI